MVDSHSSFPFITSRRKILDNDWGKPWSSLEIGFVNGLVQLFLDTQLCVACAVRSPLVERVAALMFPSLLAPSLCYFVLGYSGQERHNILRK